MNPMLQTKTNIYTALLKAQKNIEGAVKGGQNPFFKSNYATLESVIEACKKALNDEGVGVLQPITSDGQNDFLETHLFHAESGETLFSRMRILPPKNMQDMGSAISYARRYSLQSFVFMTAVDDDGEMTMQRTSPQKVEKKATLKSVEQPSSFSTGKIVNTPEEF